MHPRHKKILTLLQSGEITIPETAKELGVTEMTLRRDLRVLAKDKLVILIRGGAMLAPVQYELIHNSQEDIIKKNKIAEALYNLIMPTESLFIGAGTTTLAFAKVVALQKNPLLTVITNSLPVASALFRSSCKVILIGGELRNASLDLIGPEAEKNLLEYHVNWLVTGCDGALSDSGFYTSDVNLSNLEKKSISIAQHAAVITESRKFGHRALTRFASLDDIDLVVTDQELAITDEKQLKQARIEIAKV